MRTSALLPRYPIQTPREACYGDMDGFPGVRNYGVVDPDDLYDVYCYAEDLNGDRGRGHEPFSGATHGPPGASAEPYCPLCD